MRLISETVSMINIDIVIPVLNQLSFTKMCLDGLLRLKNIGGNIVVVDNGSTDGTAELLMTLTEVTFIRNTHNRGVAAAWNQGVMAGRAEWVILLNNDVLLPDGWIDSLIGFAIDKNMDIVSPAIREGEYNYDIVEYSRQFTKKWRGDTSRVATALLLGYVVSLQ